MKKLVLALEAAIGDTLKPLLQELLDIALQCKVVQLQKLIKLSPGLLESLYVKKVLTFQSVMNIERSGTERDKVSKLLILLKECNQSQLLAFLEVLRGDNQQQAVDFITQHSTLLFGLQKSMMTSEYTKLPFPPGMTPIPYHTLQDVNAIAEGGFGIMHSAKHPQLGVVAYKELKVKIIREDDAVAKDLLHEVQVFTLIHPNIVKLLGLTFEPGHYGLLFEYLPRGGLDAYISRCEVSWSQKLRVCQDIIQGMKYLHSKTPPVIHGDLKLQNVLMADDGTAKICDFGLSRWKTISTEKTINQKVKGTITHIAPEKFQDIHVSRSVKFDVYGFGILMWELFSGKKPFGETSNHAEIRLAVMDGQRPLLDEIVIEAYNMGDQFMKDQVNKCWSHDPNDRPTFEELEQQFAFVQ